ncbi:MAG: outer membrane protein assembly factor BamA [Pseudomonadota bacterium]
MINLRLTLSLILCTVFILFLASTTQAETATKIAIFPFSIDSQTPNPAIVNKISSLLSDLLTKEGAIVQVLLPADTSFQDFDYVRLKKIGIENGADYILIGSLFVAGDSISIDSKLINTFDEDNQIPIFSEALSIENLFSAVSKLSKEVTSIVFQKNFITDIEIIGNKRIEKDVILRNINTQQGDILKPESISNDLKKIYAMGYFDNVEVKKQTSGEGVKLIYEVAEKATVRKVKFSKNYIFEDKEIEALINTRTGSILNIHKLKEDVNRMRLMYTTKNYHNISIDYEIIPLENSQADIVFKFEEGSKVRVEKITFEGNHYFSARDIKKEIETSEKGFFSFFTSSGDLNEIEVKNDVIRIESLYKNNGFIDAKVSDPIIDIGKDKIVIGFKISEGAQYKIKSIDITGDLIKPKQEFFDLIQAKEKQLYNREFIRKDILTMSDVYLNQGYANVNITPVVDKDSKANMMSILYTIEKGDPVYFNRIKISGNHKTKDKVIRREIKIIEQDLYSKKEIQNSHKNLNRLDFFADIDVKPVKTDKKDVLDLEVAVVEKETGAFSFGGGYSSEDAVFGSISVTERNLFGNGQAGQFSVNVSESSLLYNINFYEPHIMDTDISSGIDLYKEEREYDNYDKHSIGMTLSAGYKLYDYTRIGLSYNIEDFDILNVETTSTNMTPGSFLNSSVKPFIRYDSRNDIFLPTEGQKHEFSIQYAGSVLGGDIDYIKYIAESSAYFPLFWKFTGLLHAKAGFLDDLSDTSIDIDFVRFYMGGMNSIRGFDKFDINGQREGDAIERGGEKMLQFNAELTFPFTEKYKIAGVLFYDRGDVYRTKEKIDLSSQFSSFGMGVRWNSPMGPIRVEYGWVIDGKDVKNTGDGQFEFSVGASF